MSFTTAFPNGTIPLSQTKALSVNSSGNPLQSNDDVKTFSFVVSVTSDFFALQRVPSTSYAAIAKHTIANACQIVRYCYACQAGAVVKCAFTDACNTVRNGNACQVIATAKCISANAC